jgi:hypothetical protein
LYCSLNDHTPDATVFVNSLIKTIPDPPADDALYEPHEKPLLNPPPPPPLFAVAGPAAVFKLAPGAPPSVPLDTLGVLLADAPPPA